GLVELDHGIAAQVLVEVALEDGADRRAAKEVDDVVDDPGDPGPGILEQEVAEDVSQDAVGARDVSKDCAALEVAGCVPTRSEQAVGDGLGVEVGEFSRLETADEVQLKRLEGVAQARRPL